MQETFSASLERDKDGTWWYVHVPTSVRKSLKKYEYRGIIKITASINKATWDGSILPWADGSGQISVNKRIREKENLEQGQMLTLKISVRE